MQHLLNLLAAIALLVWGTHIVRTGMLRVFGENLRTVISRSVRNRFVALLAGIGVTALVQSSTATSLIVTSFVGKGLMDTGAALAVMLGADVGTALMSVVLSFDLSWVSPLLILAGVVMFLSQEDRGIGRVGRVIIGLGLITLALQLIVAATEPLTRSPAVRAMLIGLPNDVLLEMTIGAVLAVVSYSSLATVLLVAMLANAGLLPTPVALGLVLGANLGTGALPLLATARGSVQSRRMPLGNFLFKLIGCAVVVPLLPRVHVLLQDYVPTVLQQVVVFHLVFNILRALLFIAVTPWVGRALDRWLP